jgi:acetyl-CoA acetyltransferase family protein
MSRAPFVLPKAQSPFDRAQAQVYDTTIGWRLVNAALQAAYGTDSMPETAENVAADHGISRTDQDAFALRSQERAAKAVASGRLAHEIAAVRAPQRRGDAVLVDTDEPPRETSMEALGRLRPVVRADGTVTAGNASGVNDGAAALLVMSERAVQRYGVDPLARIVATATAGVAPRVMGIGPVPATGRLLERTGVALGDVDVVEINEAFAAQSLACLRLLGLPDDAEHVNPNGGAIALGHPLGMSGARIALTAAIEARQRDAHYALATMCIGVGQGIATLLERPV